MASKYISNQMHNMSPDTLTYLVWVPDLPELGSGPGVLDLECWNEDGENERGVLVHGTLISDEEDEGEDEGVVEQS